MKQLNVSKRVTGHIQLWASVLLAILTVVFSFMPIFKIKTAEKGFVDQMNEMIEKVVPGEDLEIPEEIGISAPKLIGSISMITKIVGAVGTGENAAQKQEELEKYLESEKGKEAIVTSMAIASSLLGSFGDLLGDEEGEEKTEMNIFGLILDVMVSVIGLFAVLIFTLYLPIWAIIIALIVLIKALRNMNEPEEVSAQVAGKLVPMLTLPLSVMLFQCVVPGMSYASGIVGLCAIGIVAVALGFVLSRLRSYNKDEFVYLTIVQGGALLAIVGFMVFFFNLIKVGIFKSFVNGPYFGYMASAIVAKETGATVSGGYIVDGVMMLVYLAMVLSCTKYLAKAAQRFGGLTKKKKKGTVAMKDNNLINVIFMLPIYILPVIVKGMKHCLTSVTATSTEGATSFLTLLPAQESALTGILVGLIIMLVAEIAVVVLKKVLCKGLTEESAAAILASTVTVDHSKAAAPAAEVAAPAAEVAATETAATEETVEETVEDTKDEE